MSIPALHDEEAKELLDIIEMETGLVYALKQVHGGDDE